MPRAQNNNNNLLRPRSHSPQTPLSLRFHSSFRNILKNGRLRLPSSAGPSGAHGCEASGVQTSEVSSLKGTDLSDLNLQGSRCQRLFL